MIFNFDTEIKRQTGSKAVCYLGNLLGYMQGARFTKGGR